MTAASFGDGTAAWLTGRYRFTIRARPGYEACAAPGCELSDPVAWHWSRLHRASSTAAVTVPKNRDCCACVPRTWEHELVFGRSTAAGGWSTVWVGPVTDVQDNEPEGVLSVVARDRSAWVTGEQVMPSAVTGPAEPAARRFQRLWALADADDPSGLELVHVGEASGAVFAAGHERWAGMTGELEKLAAFGITWTVVRGRLLFGDLGAITRTPRLDTATAWKTGAALVTEVGANEISQIVVRAGERPDVFVHPAVVVPGCKGRHVRSAEVDFEMSAAEGADYARRLFERRAGQGIRVETSVDSSVSEAWPISEPLMWPGVRLTVDPSDNDFCVTVPDASAQLAELRVEGIGDRETSVKVTLAPETGALAAV